LRDVSFRLKESHDRVRAFHVVHVTSPLTDTGAAGIGHHNTTDFFKVFQQSVALGRVANQLGTRCDSKLCFHINTLLGSLTCQRCRTGQVFITGVGAGTDKSYFQFGGVFIFLDCCCKFGERPCQVRSERTIDVRLQFAQINLDNLIEILSGFS
jgi:hypothetical protein